MLFYLGLSLVFTMLEIQAGKASLLGKVIPCKYPKKVANIF